MSNKKIIDVLEKINEKKYKLRNSILLLINNFEKQTTIRVEGISFYKTGNVREVNIKLDFDM